MTGRALLFLFNTIETNFLRASSTSEFSHSLVWGLSCQVLLQLYVLRCSRFGIVDPRGAHARARCSRRNLVFGWAMRDPDHEATIRFCGEAPRRRAHSGHGFKPWLCSGHHHLGSRSAAVAKAQRTLKLDLLLLDKMFKPPTSATRHQRGFLRS